MSNPGCTLGAQCTGIGCAGGADTQGCERIGSTCLGCGVGFLAQMRTVKDAPDEATHFLILYNPRGEFVCALVEHAEAGSELRPFDRCTEINGVAPDNDFFAALANMEGKPMDFNLTVYRAGQKMQVVCKRG